MAKAATLKSRTSNIRRSRTKAAVKRLTSPPEYDLDSWLAGYEAGGCGRPIEPPKAIEVVRRGVPSAIGLLAKSGVDRPSWLAGYVEGAGQNTARAVCNNIRRYGGAGDNYSDYCGVGSVAFSNGFKMGMRLAVLHAWRHDEPRRIG
jgi:hypothetical protein